MKRFVVLSFLTVLLSPALAADIDETVPVSINPELRQHTNHFEKKIYKVGENIYSAVGWSLGNTVMIEGDDGIILVDVGTEIDSAKQVREELRKITDKPVKAVVYTHFHPDHWGGVKAYVSEDDAKEGRVRIFAHETLVKNVLHQGDLVGPILSMRTAYSFGMSLPEEDHEGMNGGIGPRESGGKATFIPPTDVFETELNVTIAGVRMQMVHVPSEAPDEIAIYLPDSGILLSAETIQGPTLPNIHTIRGTRFRDPRQWYESLDHLRAFNAVAMVPAHGQPVIGAEKVEEVLRMTRDGIQFIHDQTVRHMNKGLTPDELANKVALPPHLADYGPYLREYYGTVKHAVRQIYTGYLGWFEGDPVGLDPIPRLEAAKRMVALMGGAQKVLNAAESAYDDDDYQWAAELATFVIRIDNENQRARKIKAASLRRLGYASMNINWRNWYLSSAQELEGNIDIPAMQLRIIQTFLSQDVIAEMPLSAFLNSLPVRLRAEDALDVELAAGFVSLDTGESHGLEIRKGIVQFADSFPRSVDFAVAGKKEALMRLVQMPMLAEQAIESGDITLIGSDKKAALQFFTLFEPPLAPIALTVR